MYVFLVTLDYLYMAYMRISMTCLGPCALTLASNSCKKLKSQCSKTVVTYAHSSNGQCDFVFCSRRWTITGDAVVGADVNIWTALTCNFSQKHAFCAWCYMLNWRHVHRVQQGVHVCTIHINDALTSYVRRRRCELRRWGCIIATAFRKLYI